MKLKTHFIWRYCSWKHILCENNEADNTFCVDTVVENILCENTAAENTDYVKIL
jgi:hypothetical protein